MDTAVHWTVCYNVLILVAQFYHRKKRKNCCTSDQRMNCLNYKKWGYHADRCFLPDSQVNVANFRCSSSDHWRLYWLSLFLHYKEDQVHLTSLWEPRCYCWQTKTASGSRPDPRGHVGARSAVPGVNLDGPSSKPSQPGTVLWAAS